MKCRETTTNNIEDKMAWEELRKQTKKLIIKNKRGWINSKKIFEQEGSKINMKDYYIKIKYITTSTKV